MIKKKLPTGLCCSYPSEQGPFRLNIFYLFANLQLNAKDIYVYDDLFSENLAG